MGNVTNAPPGPRLVLLDTSAAQQGHAGLPTEIQFKYQPQDLTEDVGANWGSSTGMNRADPILQYSHGDQRGFSFTMKLWADHSEVNIDDQITLLKRCVLKDEDLKRPPRFQFIWGTFIDETVVVSSIGGIKYDELRSDGTCRGATLSVRLLIYKSVDVALVAEDRPTDTFFTTAKSGDTWEHLALREYDDPELGEILRRRNPSIPFPGNEPQRIVTLPKIENIRNEIIEPDSIPLARTEEGLKLRAAMYEKRSVSRETTILKK